MTPTRYRTIVADPPWDYPEGFAERTGHPHKQDRERGVTSGKVIRRDLPYGSMTADEIAALPVADLAERDARLFLWTTNRHLPAAFGVAIAWGFRYRQLIVWDKRPNVNPLGGSIAPNSAEYLLGGAGGCAVGRYRGVTFDAIHASPPCQHDTTMGQRYAETQAKHPDLIGPTQTRLRALNVPYVIENVLGARRKLDHPIMLCGRALGLGVARHRLFECNFACFATQCACRGDEVPVYGKLDGRRLWTRVDGSELRAAGTLEQASEAMGIDWMQWDDLREAIPPAMTEHVGFYLMAAVQTREAA